MPFLVHAKQKKTIENSNLTNLVHFEIYRNNYKAWQNERSVIYLKFIFQVFQGEIQPIKYNLKEKVENYTIRLKIGLHFLQGTWIVKNDFLKKKLKKLIKISLEL